VGRHRKVRTRERISLAASATAVVAVALVLAHGPHSSIHPATSSAPAPATKRAPEPVESVAADPLPRIAPAGPHITVPREAGVIDHREAHPAEQVAFGRVNPVGAVVTATPTTGPSPSHQGTHPPDSRRSATPVAPSDRRERDTCLLCFLGHVIGHLTGSG
jgi:hypothetical protein